MEPTTLIIGALAAGATAAVKDTASQAAKDAYAGLKALIQRRFSEKKSPEGEIALTKFDEKPNVWEAPLKDALVETETNKATEILKAAEAPKQALEQTPEGRAAVSKYILNIQSSEVGVRTDIGPNPYLGLGVFQEHDADRFFGREKLTKVLWEKFRDLNERGSTEEKIRLLPILGPSGSGKSSVARAGLIPELARNALPGYARARVAIFTPGTDPVHALAGILARMTTSDAVPANKTREFAGELNTPNDKGEFDGLARIAGFFPDIHDSPLVILADQFEEVYSLCEDKDKRNCFIGNLLHAASDAAGYVSVILTLRSDFLGETHSRSGDRWRCSDG